MTTEHLHQLTTILAEDGAYDVIMETARYLVNDLAPMRETVRPDIGRKCRDTAHELATLANGLLL